MRSFSLRHFISQEQSEENRVGGSFSRNAQAEIVMFENRPAPLIFPYKTEISVISSILPAKEMRKQRPLPYKETCEWQELKSVVRSSPGESPSK
jgi:hypothetical protein